MSLVDRSFQEQVCKIYGCLLTMYSAAGYAARDVVRAAAGHTENVAIRATVRSAAGYAAKAVAAYAAENAAGYVAKAAVRDAIRDAIRVLSKGCSTDSGEIGVKTELARRTCDCGSTRINKIYC